MSAFVQKIILTVLAVGIYALSALPALKDVALLLQPVAGLLIGAAWITKPGDGQLVEAGKQAIRARSIPPVAIVLSVLLLGCGAAGYDPKDARDAANAMRTTLNEAGDTVALAGGGIDFVCAYYGESSRECTSLEDGFEVARLGLTVLHSAVDTAEDYAVIPKDVASRVQSAMAQSKVFAAKVAALSDEVKHVLADRRVPQAGGAPAPQPTEAAAPAEGAAANPAAAAAP